MSVSNLNKSFNMSCLVCLHHPSNDPPTVPGWCPGTKLLNDEVEPSTTFGSQPNHTTKGW